VNSQTAERIVSRVSSLADQFGQSAASARSAVPQTAAVEPRLRKSFVLARRGRREVDLPLLAGVAAGKIGLMRHPYCSSLLREVAPVLLSLTETH
jgi:hypothetical protein